MTEPVLSWIVLFTYTGLGIGGGMWAYRRTWTSDGSTKRRPAVKTIIEEPHVHPSLKPKFERRKFK